MFPGTCQQLPAALHVVLPHWPPSAGHTVHRMLMVGQALHDATHLSVGCCYGLQSFTALLLAGWLP
jgi:hypothetical protein